MNIRILSISAILLTLFGASFAAAQVSASGSASAEANAGGLGGGISTMVRGILGENEPAMQRKMPEAPQATMMMLVAPEADATANLMVYPDDISAQDRAVPGDMSFKSVSYAAAPAMTEEDLSTYMHAVLAEDLNIHSIDAADGHVRISYTSRMKFLGLFEVPVIVKAAVYASGETSLSVPWFARLPGISPEDRTRFATTMSGYAMPEGYSPEVRMQIIAAMHSYLQAEFSETK